MPGDNFDKLVQQYGSDVAQRTEKYNRLKDLEIFVMDNSIRESTVGKYDDSFLQNFLDFLRSALKHCISMYYIYS